MNLRWLIFLLPVFLFFSSYSQQLFETKINVATGSKVDKRDAIIYLPANYSKSKSYPLIVFTHGMGEAGKNIKKLYNQGLPKVLKQGYRPPFDFIMVAVQRNSFSVMPEWLPGILEDCQARWKIKKERIYLTGLSAGGWAAYGSQLNMSQAFAKKFAAIVINSGVTHNINKKNLDWWKNTKTPVWAIVGAADKSYVTKNSYMVKEINKRVPESAILTIRKGIGHGGWSDVYKGKVENDGKNIWEWMYQFKRSADGSLEKDDGASNNDGNDLRYINVKVYSGKNPYNSSRWYNWDVGSTSGAGIKTKALDYADGKASKIYAELSKSERVVDNTSGYGSGMAPAEVLRHTSFTESARNLTISGLSGSKTYTIELFASRRRNPDDATIYKIAGTTRKISTYNNFNNEAVFRDVKPDKNNRIIIRIESARTYNYLNGFTITEKTPGDDDDD